MTDRVTGLIGLVFALTYGLVGSRFHSDFITDPLGPAAFPVMLAVVLGCFCLLLLVRPRGEADWPPREAWLRKGAAIGAMIVYAVVLEPIGFLVASALLIAALVMIMAGSRRQSVLIGIGTSVALYVLFDPLLGLPLPTGALFAGFLGG